MEPISHLFSKTKLFTILGVISLLGMFAACGDLERDPAGNPGPNHEPELLSIIETAEAAGDFTILLAALTEAGLAPIFADDDAGPFTVFAPTDAAFLALLEALDISAEELLASEDLVTILQYHVVAGTLLEADVSNAICAGGGIAAVETLANEAITATIEDGVIVINGVANVIATDIQATNGVIHVIDEVLLPPAKPELLSILETAEAAGDFTILLAALTEAGLAPIFADDDAGPFTVFAPTDAAFLALLEELQISAEELLASDDLATILQYHVVEGELLEADVLAAINAGDGKVKVETLAQKPIKVELKCGVLVINRVANVIATDISATNGVIHVIDAVLLPDVCDKPPKKCKSK